MSYTAIIDYGVGNLFSIVSSLKYLNIDSVVTHEVSKIENASHIILPGVGAFGDAMEKLKESDLIPVLERQVKKGTPVMGICLGMQLLFEKGYEYGEHTGLSWLKGSVCPIADRLEEKNSGLKIPHMGWNRLAFAKKDSPVLKYISDGDFVYFVHSYYADGCEENLSAWAEYGIKIPAVVEKENIFGCQFHPEKSGQVGLGIIRAFSEI